MAPRRSPRLLLATAAAALVAALALLQFQPAQGFLLPTPSANRQQQRLPARARTPLAAANALPPKAEYDLELFSPAKVNLFLRIIRRREDGYHELASLFQTVGFGDTLLFKASGRRDAWVLLNRLVCTHPRSNDSSSSSPSHKTTRTPQRRSSAPARPPTSSAPPSLRS